VRETEHRRIMREGTTMHQFAVSQAGELSGGRFGVATPAPSVTGATAIPYSSLSEMPASSPWSGAQPQPQPGPEPPLGFDNPALESSAVPASVEEGAPVSEAPPSAVQASPPADAVETSAGALPSLTRTKRKRKSTARGSK
jgi:hypothetical protein